MFTGSAPEYIRHVYEVNSELKSYTVYSIVDVKGSQLLPDLLRIEKFAGKSNATGIDDYLRIRTATSWDKSEKVTGLRPTEKSSIYYGDWTGATRPKTLLMFTFTSERKLLVIDVYRGFYPHHRGILNDIIRKYNTPIN
jgi:hypothetical protein